MLFYVVNLYNGDLWNTFDDVSEADAYCTRLQNELEDSEHEFTVFSTEEYEAFLTGNN